MRRLVYLLTVFVIILLGIDVLAQESVELRIAQLDISEFPLVRINLATANEHSVPLAIDAFSSLSLRENRIPIADFELQPVPVGVDVVFVVDANSTFADIDDSSGLSRRDKVQISLERFAGRMNPTGLDRVSLIIPDADNANGFLLVQDATRADEITTAFQGYNPETLTDTPLNEMVQLGLDHLARLETNGRFQAILLFTDGRQLNQQLAYDTLVESALEQNVPIFAAILGTVADLNEIDNVTRLSTPTRGDYVHMPSGEETDSIYLVWQQQGNQPQIQYRSLQTSSGEYPLMINVGSLTASTTLALTLEPPEVSVDLGNEAIQRVGEAFDTPLVDLVPTTKNITVTVQWPDALPRQITVVNWFVNGQPQTPLEAPIPNEAGKLFLSWDMQTLDTGTYEHRIQVIDELGFVVDSPLVWATILSERPLLATPTLEPTPTSIPPATPTPSLQNLSLLLGVVGLTAVVLLLLRWLRRRRRQSKPVTKPETERPPKKPSQAPVVQKRSMDDNPLFAFLDVLENAEQQGPIPITTGNMTLGRDHEVAQIVFADRTVSRLHARIRQRGVAYWLYDEGSSTGTYLNFEKLGLAPHVLNHGDTIRLGRVTLRFRLVTSEVMTDGESQDNDASAVSINE